MWVLLLSLWCLVPLLGETKNIMNNFLSELYIWENHKIESVQFYTLIFIEYLLAGVTFVVVVCVNSNEKDK